MSDGVQESPMDDQALLYELLDRLRMGSRGKDRWVPGLPSHRHQGAGQPQLESYVRQDQSSTGRIECYSADDLYGCQTEGIQQRLKELGINTASVVADVKKMLNVKAPSNPAQHLYAMLEADEEDIVRREDVAQLSQAQVSERLRELGIAPQPTCKKIRALLSEKEKVHCDPVVPLRRKDPIKHQGHYFSGKGTRRFLVSAVGIITLVLSTASSVRIKDVIYVTEPAPLQHSFAALIEPYSLSTTRGAAQIVIVGKVKERDLFITVRSGDNLSSIAKDIYGSAQKWRVIHEYNKDKLKSPDMLPVGIRLKVRPPFTERARVTERPRGVRFRD